jgi:hypothetical protein
MLVVFVVLESEILDLVGWKKRCILVGMLDREDV